MTATATTPAATQREIVSEDGGGAYKGDSPAVRAQARARIPVADGDRGAKTSRVSPLAAVRAWAGVWWVWIARPPSLKQMWDMSKVDPRRIPDVPLFRVLWHVSNWSDRLILSALVFVTPNCLAGPVRWITCRPLRRYGFYAVVALLTIAYLLGRS